MPKMSSNNIIKKKSKKVCTVSTELKAVDFFCGAVISSQNSNFELSKLSLKKISPVHDFVSPNPI